MPVEESNMDSGPTVRSGSHAESQPLEDLLSDSRKTAPPVEDADREFPGCAAPRDAAFALIGTAPAIQEICSMIRCVAPSQAPVLITGENGTEKEIVARQIHQWSRNAKGPFVAVNTAALPAAMVESELFGHEQGAFSGATDQHLGYF